jgi:hypothetical protein
MFTRLWVKASKLRRAKFLEVIRKNENILDEKYFEAVTKRRSSVFGALLKAYTIQIPILTFLVLSLIPIQANVSIFGLSPTSNKNLREILIVVSAMIGLGIGFVNYYHDALSEILAAYAERRSKGDKDVEELLKVGYGLDIFPLPPPKHGDIQLGWGYLLFLFFFAFVALSLLGVVAAGALYIHFLVLQDIYYKPSFSTTASLWVIGFVLVCDFLTITIAIFSGGMIIARDFSNVMAISKMDEEKAKAIYVAMWTRHFKKPWLLRLLTRAKMPRKLT